MEAVEGNVIFTGEGNVKDYYNIVLNANNLTLELPPPSTIVFPFTVSPSISTVPSATVLFMEDIGK